MLKTDMSSVCCEIIKTCPLSCLHCSAKSHINTNRQIPFDDLKKIIEQAKYNNVETFYISGGEPLLHPDLTRLVAHLKREKINPVIYSSGCLPDKTGNTLHAISKKTLRNLEAAGLRSIVFSLYSLDPKQHDQITNTPNSFKTLMTTLENARNFLVDTKMELSYIPLSDTWEQIDKILNFSNSNNIDKLNILKLINQGRAKESGIIHRNLSHEDEVIFLERLRNFKLQDTTIEISKLYDCDHYEHLQISPYTAGENEYFITHRQEVLPGRRFRN